MAKRNPRNAQLRIPRPDSEHCPKLSSEALPGAGASAGGSAGAGGGAGASGGGGGAGAARGRPGCPLSLSCVRAVHAGARSLTLHHICMVGAIVREIVSGSAIGTAAGAGGAAGGGAGAGAGARAACTSRVAAMLALSSVPVIALAFGAGARWICPSVIHAGAYADALPHALHRATAPHAFVTHLRHSHGWN